MELIRPSHSTVHAAFIDDERLGSGRQVIDILLKYRISIMSSYNDHAIGVIGRTKVLLLIRKLGRCGTVLLFSRSESVFPNALQPEIIN